MTLYSGGDVFLVHEQQRWSAKARLYLPSLVNDRLQGGGVEPCCEKYQMKRLPILLHKGSRRFQYAWDGQGLRVVEDLRALPSDSSVVYPHDWVGLCVNRMAQMIKSVFVPDHVRPNYMAYVRWKCLHRIFSSALQVQCTQAMLRAVGVGAERALPSAAALNWVLKDGLGRLGRLVFTAGLSCAFDSDLKKIRFSTSVLYSMSLGLELLTPRFPEKFLLLAAIANIAKSISLAAYLATSSAVHRSFALADNLADISAKGQAQTVVLDNLGLGLAVCINHLCKHNRRLKEFFPLVTYPIFSAVDLFALYNGLNSIYFPTLNKTRLEIIVDKWLHYGKVPSVEEVNKAEGLQLLPCYGGRSLPLRIGAFKSGNQKPNDLLRALNTQSEEQKYLLCLESCHSAYKDALLLWPHITATGPDIILGVLQASFLRSVTDSQQSARACLLSGEWPYSSQRESESFPKNIGECLLNKHDRREVKTREQCQNLFRESRNFAIANVGILLKDMEESGWLIKHVLLSYNESMRYSILNS
eukprot:c21745_g1_i1 orf=102-1685(-)